MTDLDKNQDVCRLVTVTEDTVFRTSIKDCPTGIIILPEEYGESKQRIIKQDAGQFAKWLKINEPELNVVLLEPKLPKLVLKNSDIWLPLVALANNVALPIYLSMVANFLYDKMKGALKNETPRVHLNVEFEDKVSGKVKRFTFQGDADALKNAIKRFDLNEFLDE